MQPMSSRSGIPAGRSNEIIRMPSGAFSSTREKDKYVEDFNFPFCDDASKYERVTKIGQGTFGYVKFISRFILQLSSSLFCSTKMYLLVPERYSKHEIGKILKSTWL